jgi:hypothetical protein
MADELPMPDRARVTLALQAFSLGTANPDDLAEIVEAAKWALHALPEGVNFSELASQNPLPQVQFRAGLLACREYMARFVEQGGDATTAMSIRANWWPILGDDPGAPRLFDLDEVAEEYEKDGKPAWRSKPISASVEALPRAFHFLQWSASAAPTKNEAA